MKLQVDEIKEDIRDAMNKYLGIRIEDDDKNLLSSDLHAIVPDFLYVLNALEQKYSASIYRLFEQNDYSVFSVNGLAQAILEVGQCHSTPND